MNWKKLAPWLQALLVVSMVLSGIMTAFTPPTIQASGDQPPQNAYADNRVMQWIDWNTGRPVGTLVPRSTKDNGVPEGQPGFDTRIFYGREIVKGAYLVTDDGYVAERCVTLSAPMNGVLYGGLINPPFGETAGWPECSFRAPVLPQAPAPQPTMAPAPGPQPTAPPMYQPTPVPQATYAPPPAPTATPGKQPEYSGEGKWMNFAAGDTNVIGLKVEINGKTFEECFIRKTNTGGRLYHGGRYVSDRELSQARRGACPV